MSRILYGEFPLKKWKGKRGTLACRGHESVAIILYRYLVGRDRDVRGEQTLIHRQFDVAGSTANDSLMPQKVP